MDTYEFYNILCDNIESCSPESAKLLKDSIGGVLINETRTIDKDYPYLSQREEPFTGIQLDIKNKRNLQEALDMYVKPDILEGDNKYHCDKYDKKLDA